MGHIFLTRMPYFTVLPLVESDSSSAVRQYTDRNTYHWRRKSHTLGKHFFDLFLDQQINLPEISSWCCIDAEEFKWLRRRREPQGLRCTILLAYRYSSLLHPSFKGPRYLLLCLWWRWSQSTVALWKWSNIGKWWRLVPKDLDHRTCNTSPSSSSFSSLSRSS